VPRPRGDEGTTLAALRVGRRAFRAFYERTAPQIRTYLRRTTSDPDAAEDLLQETYVRYLSADVPSMGEAEATQYLYRVATNLAIDRWRRADVERRASRTRLIETAQEPPQVDLRRDISAALDRLTPRHRAIVWLAYVEGYSHREIAEIVDVKPASVRVLLFRARNRLAGILEEAGFESGARS